MIFDEIKFLLQKILGAKYKIIGQCKKCGRCCREITFLNGHEYVANVQQFEALKKFDKSYNNFEIAGFDEIRKALLFKCKALSDDNKCRQYFFRSLPCRLYPNPSKKFMLAGGQLLDGCGFTINTTKKFEDFLTK